MKQTVQGTFTNISSEEATAYASVDFPYLQPDAPITAPILEDQNRTITFSGTFPSLALIFQKVKSELQKMSYLGILAGIAILIPILILWSNANIKCVTEDSVYLRSDPAVASENMVGYAYKGDCFFVKVDRSNKEWLQIESGLNKDKWVSVNALTGFIFRAKANGN